VFSKADRRLPNSRGQINHNETQPGPEVHHHSAPQEDEVKTKNWTGRFPAFVFAYGGPLKLAADLGVVHSSVYHWMSGSWPPKYKTAQQIVELAQSAKFALSIDDVMNHSQTVARGDR
jgi:hypothetical protein